MEVSVWLALVAASGALLVVFEAMPAAVSAMGFARIATPHPQAG
ncbi:hypothetical protein [Oceaniglobus indicus]|nr:hypothetical protein [Oceaniglobus indicus]